MGNLKIHVILYIRSSAQDVWAALTDPNQTSLYWGGGTRIESEWQPGSKIQYRRDGKVTDEHTVIKSNPPKHLSHTFAPRFGEFKREKPSRVTIEIEQNGEVSMIELVHDDFEDGSKVFEQCSRAWPMILSSMKSLLETGRELPEASPE